MLAHLIQPTVALQPGWIRRLCRIRQLSPDAMLAHL
ncbi:hypothetical protein ECP02989427_4947, partial [Escherichia coli P0298942.7]